MAVNTKAIGLLFEVAGGGSISGETGKKINDQLRSIVKAINDADTLKLQFQLDDSKFNADLERIKKELQSLSSTSVSIGTHSGRGSGSGGTGGKGGSSAHTAEWKKATEALRNYYRLRTQLEQAMTRTGSITPQLGADGNATGQYSTTSARWSELVQQVNNARVALEGYGDGAKLSAQELATLTERESQATAKLNLDIQNFTANAQGAWSNLTAKVNDYVQRVKYSASRDPKAAEGLQRLQEIANSSDWTKYDELKEKLAEVRAYIDGNSLATETWFQKMKKTFGTRVRSLLSGLILAKVTQSLRDIYKYVVEIDTAMTNLKIVTQATDSAMARYAKTASEAAVKIGASVSALINSTTTYARLGFSLEDAAKFAELTAQYSKVADVDVGEATKNITALVKAYHVGADDLESALDKLMYVGRSYAISSAELGEGLNNAASILYANKNTMEQSLGMLAAANSSVQNISRASTGLRTIAARLAAAKTSLEQNGDDTEGMADSIFKLEAAMRGYGISIRDGNNNLKSTYDILDQIAAKWSSLEDDQRQAIIGMAAGTRQQDIFTSLIQNWGDATSVVTNVNNASGELARATEERLDSIQGKLDQLKATLETFSTAILSSEVVKFIVDAVSALLNALIGIVETAAKITKALGGLKTVILAVATATLLAKGGLLLYNLELAKTAILTGVVTFFTKLKRAIVSIIDIIPNAIAAWRAYAAGIVSASTAMQASIPIIGLVLAAITAVVGAVSLFGSKSKQSAEDIYEAANAAAELSDTLYGLTEEYITLSKAVRTSDDAKKQLLETQDELIEKLGLERYQLKELENQYGSTNKAIVAATITGLQDEERKLAAAVATAQSATKKEAVRGAVMSLAGIGTWAPGSTESGVATLKELDLLQSKGYIDSYNAKIKTDKSGRQYVKKVDAPQLIDVNGYNWDDPNSIRQYRDKVREMLSLIEDEVGRTGATYTWLYSAYDTVNDLLKQYDDEAEKLNKNLAQQYVLKDTLANDTLPSTQEEFTTFRDRVLEAAIASREFVGTNEDVADAIDSVLRKRTEFSQFYTDVVAGQTGVTRELKSLLDILEEVQPGFDGIVSALKSLTKDGYLGADALSKLIQLEKDGALAGLSLNAILSESDDGFKLSADALDQYINKLLSLYAVEGSFATQQDKENAITNLENLRRVLVTLARTQQSTTDTINAQKDALKDQLNAYKELIDLRKKLLKQYEDELRYKKDLAEKETRVSQLQSQLAISQLDTSAAGRAKSRELAKDLQEAQEDLDDFNLEHAIEVVTNELDSQYEEYEAYINGRLDAIDQSIKGLDLDVDTSQIETYLESINALLEQIKGKETVLQEDAPDDNGGSFEQAKAYIASHGLMQGDKGRWGQDPAFRKILNQLTPEEFAALKGYTQGKAVYDADGRLIRYEKIAPTYHSGGIVGDMTRLKSTELFAKLLQGEFVATPQMMKRFMTSTLPEIASSGMSGGTNEFNAPLISIQCDNVTQESLPGLKEIVDDAVKQIKKQFDDGLGRAGFHKTVKQIV